MKILLKNWLILSCFLSLMKQTYCSEIDNIEKSQTVAILHKAYSIVNSDDIKHVISTFTAEGDIVIGIYNPTSKKAGLINCNNFDDYKKELYQKVQASGIIDNKNSTVSFASQTQGQLDNFINHFIELGFAAKDLRILLHPNMSSVKVSIDVQKGTFFTTHYSEN